MHSFVRFLSRFVLFASTLRLILGSSLSEAAEPAADKPSVLLLGITRGSSDEQATAAPEIESAVAARLRSLGFSVVEMGSEGARSASPPIACAKGECLPARAQSTGTDLAMIGSVLRLPDLCSADLWLYDRHSGSSRRAEIQCQPKTPEFVLSDEFADQAGRLSEPPPAPLLVVPERTQPLAPAVAPPASVFKQKETSRYWGRGRLASVGILTLSSAALWTSAIVISSMTCPSGNCTAQVGALDPFPLDQARWGLLTSSAVCTIGLTLAMAIPER